MAKHWYRVDLLTGTQTRGVIGTSDLSPQQLTEKLQGDDYLVLNDLSYNDKNRIVPISSWDSTLGSVIYINPRHVLTVTPLVGDPGAAQ
jgi:hypothetical protein